MQSQRYESSQRLVTNDIMIHVTSFSKRVAPACLFDFVGRTEIHLGPLHMSPVDRAGPVSEISPHL